MSEDTTKYPKTGRRGAPQVFPRKLYEILTDEQDSVSWSKNGKSFTICDMDTFSNDVLLNYFRHQKYSSFQRQLNLYGFRKICKGPDVGAYAHEFFMRDKPDQLKNVRRLPQGSKPRLDTESSQHAPASSEDRASSPPPSTLSRLTSCLTSRTNDRDSHSSGTEDDEEEKSDDETSEDEEVSRGGRPLSFPEAPPSRPSFSNENSRVPTVDDSISAGMFSFDDGEANEASFEGIVRVQPLPEECIVPRSSFFTETAVDGLSAIVDKIALDRSSNKSPPLAVATSVAHVESVDRATNIITPASLHSMIPVLARHESSFPRLEIEKAATDALSSTTIDKEMIMSPFEKAPVLGRLSSFGWNVHTEELGQFTPSDLEDIWNPAAAVNKVEIER